VEKLSNFRKYLKDHSWKPANIPPFKK